ncbi:uncharacterized protein [Choristoneura fumiferana]|uniref:uncharacterized protein n=1 Tax=Choristoneura fumiferana TaxID=7141 RepID=UPI003D1558A2
MVRYFIYAKDYSGSTEGAKFYHDRGLQTLEQFKSDIKKINNKLSESEKAEQSRIIYLHWGHVCTEENEKTVIDTYKNRMGDGWDTRPETIIKWIKNNIDGNNSKIELLYIITDGLIYRASSDECMKLNSDMRYENVVFHGFHEDLRQIDLSVAASFLKCRCSIYRNYELLDDTDISEEYDYDKINFGNFVTEKESLKSYIKLKYINNFKMDGLALQEIDKLKKLRDRLFKELASDSEKRKVNLNTMDRTVFLTEFCNTNWYKNLNFPAHGAKVEIEKSISTLINYISNDKKSYSFDALKFDTQFDTPVVEEPIVDVNFAPEQEIEFPDIIMYDDKGIPVVLLTEFSLLDKIIFHKTKSSDEVSPASFNKFKSAMECPLFLLNDPDISESIGYFYTLNVYKKLLENPVKTEPRTRRPFHGGLVLIDTDEFDKYNDYILSATYFDSKKVNYNIGLFYFVLWKNCENKEWMDKNVIEQFKKYVMRRISVAKCKIGLSSLPLDPPETTSLLSALWYCVELSSVIFKDDPQNFMHERLRMHYGVANRMIEILKYFKYDLDLEFIVQRRDLIRHVMILKKIPTRVEKVYYLLEKIFKNINGFLVSEIEHPSNLNKLNYLKLSHKGMLCDDVIEEQVHLNDYVHLMHFVDDPNLSANSTPNFKMCEKTFRPFFTIDQSKSFYSELVKITKKVVISNDDNKDTIKITYDSLDSLEFDKILSLYNLFIKCVHDSEKYPTLPEYVEYIAKKKKFSGELVTIFPSNVYIAAERVYSRYQDIMEKISVDKFIKAGKSYVTRLDRIKAEEVLQYSNNKEIEEFISREELNVNLIKRVN